MYVFANLQYNFISFRLKTLFNINIVKAIIEINIKSRCNFVYKYITLIRDKKNLDMIFFIYSKCISYSA